MLLFRREIVFAGTFAAVLVAAGGASAHHTLEALYDTSVEMQATVMLAKVEWINPHAWFRFDVPYPAGRVEKNVLFETLSLSGLRANGVDKDALKVGTRYAITYYPTRDGGPGGFVTKMVLPTGDMISAPAYVDDDDQPG